MDGCQGPSPRRARVCRLERRRDLRSNACSHRRYRISTTVKPRMLSPTADSITFSWAYIGALSREKWAATAVICCEWGAIRPAVTGRERRTCSKRGENLVPSMRTIPKIEDWSARSRFVAVGRTAPDFRSSLWVALWHLCRNQLKFDARGAGSSNIWMSWRFLQAQPHYCSVRLEKQALTVPLPDRLLSRRRWGATQAHSETHRAIAPLDFRGRQRYPQYLARRDPYPTVPWP